jgi:hypothetical protein
MSIMTKEGFSQLRFGYLIFVVGLGVAIFLVTGTYLYWQAEKKNNVQSQRTFSDMQSRLANAKRERDDLRNSEDTYKALTARGIFITEKRLDLLDAMEALKNRHKISTLEYEMSAQRPLQLASGTSLTAIDALGSRIRLKATALHDGDMVAFLDEFPRMQRGLFPIDRCIIKRNQASAAEGANPANVQISVADLINNNADDNPDANADAAAKLLAEKLKPKLEIDCALEWITLFDKSAPIVPIAAVASNTATAGAQK